jgi:hypothetical protein
MANVGAVPLTSDGNDILVAPFHLATAEQALGTCVARVWSNDVTGMTDRVLTLIHPTIGLQGTRGRTRYRCLTR